MGEGGWNLSLKSQQLPRIRGMGMLRFLKNVAATAAPEVGTLPIISSQESVSETILASIAPSFVQDCAFLLGNFLLGPSSYWTFLLRTALCRHPGLWGEGGSLCPLSAQVEQFLFCTQTHTHHTYTGAEKCAKINLPKYYWWCYFNFLFYKSLMTFLAQWAVHQSHISLSCNITE